MEWYEIIIGFLILFGAVGIIGLVLLQEGRRSGIAGAIGGGAETFLSKNKARNFSAKAARYTRYLAIAFIVLVLVSNVISLLK